jgi:hypothetical protein
MTSRERLLTSFRRERPDRVPAGSFTLGRIDLETDLGREFLRGTDSIHSPGAGFSFLSPATEGDSEWIDEGNGSTRLVRHGPAGDLVWRYQRTEKTSACMEFPCKTAADLDRVLAIPYVPCAPDFEGYHRERERFGDDVLTMPGIPNAVCWAADLLAPEDFCLLWIEDPRAMIELVAEANRRLVPFARAACAGGMEVLRIVGGEYVTVQLGPSGVEPLLGRFDVPLMDAIHEGGGLGYYHCHGPVMPFLADLCDLGIDALDPFEAPPWGDCDLVRAKEICAGRVCIVGNLDDMEVLDKYPESEVRRIGRERIRQAGPDGFVLGGTASGTFGEHAARNFLVLAEVAQEYAGLV